MGYLILPFLIMRQQTHPAQGRCKDRFGRMNYLTCHSWLGCNLWRRASTFLRTPSYRAAAAV